MIYIIIAVMFIVLYLAIGCWVYYSTRNSFKGIIVWWLPVMFLFWLIRNSWLPFGYISDNDEGEYV